MDQVCVLSQLARVGWEGFTQHAPIANNVYAQKNVFCSYLDRIFRNKLLKSNLS